MDLFSLRHHSFPRVLSLRSSQGQRQKNQDMRCRHHRETHERHQQVSGVSQGFSHAQIVI